MTIYGIIVIVYASNQPPLPNLFWYHTALTALGLFMIGPITSWRMRRIMRHASRIVEVPADIAQIPEVQE